MNTCPPLAVAIHDRADDASWRAFLSRSNSGTIFHDLDFLDYHPPGRFELVHLVARRQGSLVAILPGGVDDGLYRSPLGASVGGPALTAEERVGGVVGIVEALQRFAVQRDWRGIEMTLPPPVVHGTAGEAVQFALHRCGFHLSRRSMTLMVPLDSNSAGPRSDHLFSKGHRSAVRAARRRGELEVVEGGLNLFEEFSSLFDETYARHGTAPTHTKRELLDLMERLPDRVRLWVARHHGQPAATTMLFKLTARTATAFYICDRVSLRAHHGSSVLFAEVVDALADRGFRYLDLGVSAAPHRYNRGAIEFKQHLGAQPFCRDTYLWMP